MAVMRSRNQGRAATAVGALEIGIGRQRQPLGCRAVRRVVIKMDFERPRAHIDTAAPGLHVTRAMNGDRANARSPCTLRITGRRGTRIPCPDPASRRPRTEMPSGLNESQPLAVPLRPGGIVGRRALEPEGVKP